VIDIFVVATATFRLLYALIVLSLDRRRVVHFEVTPNPTQCWLSRQMTGAFLYPANCCETGTNRMVHGLVLYNYPPQAIIGGLHHGTSVESRKIGEATCPLSSIAPN
jgi:hypothetical protein